MANTQDASNAIGRNAKKFARKYDSFPLAHWMRLGDTEHYFLKTEISDHELRCCRDQDIGALIGRAMDHIQLQVVRKIEELLPHSPGDAIEFSVRVETHNMERDIVSRSEIITTRLSIGFPRYEQPFGRAIKFDDPIGLAEFSR